MSTLDFDNFNNKIICFENTKVQLNGKQQYISLETKIIKGSRSTKSGCKSH